MLEYPLLSFIAPKGPLGMWDETASLLPDTCGCCPTRCKVELEQRRSLTDPSPENSIIMLVIEISRHICFFTVVRLRSDNNVQG